MCFGTLLPWDIGILLLAAGAHEDGKTDDTSVSNALSFIRLFAAHG
jgi:hypothetical protein